MSPFMASVQAIAREHRCAVVLLHHAGKSEGGANYRGSSAIGAGISIEVALVAHDGDPDPERRRSRWGKMRPAARPTPLWLRITSDDGRLRIEPTTAYVPEQGPAGTTTEALAQQMATVLADRGELTWGSLCGEVGRSPEDGTAKRARVVAVDADLIEKTGHGKYKATVPGQPSGHGPTDGPTQPDGHPSIGPTDQRPKGPAWSARSETHDTEAAR